MLDVLAQGGIATIEADTDPEPGPPAVDAVALNRAGSILATGGSDGTLRLWDVVTHRQIGAPITAVSNPSSDTGGVHALAFSPDGKIVAGGHNGVDGSIRLWDTASGERVVTLEPAGHVSSIAFGRDGKMLVAGNASNGIQLWDVSKKEFGGGNKP